MSPSSLAAAGAMLAVIAAAVPARAQSWQSVAPGVEYAAYSSGPTLVYAARIDLCAPGVRMRATRPGEGPRTVSSFGQLVGATIAINGDWWSNDGEPQLPSTYPRGLSVGDGEHFPGTVDRPFYGVVAFGPAIALHSIMEDDLGGPHWWMQDVVSGQPTLLWDGALRDNPNNHCGVRRARTATGFDASMTTMYMAVVQEVGGSQGMTCNQMAALMQQLGAHSALNQDGGGSSTMWRAGVGVVNSPTDGQQRSLVNHWGVVASGWGPSRSCVDRDIAPAEAGVRRHVTSPEIMSAWGFEFSDVTFMSAESLDAYQEGQPVSQPPRFVRDSEDGLWLIDSDVRRRLPAGAAELAWRVRRDEAPRATEELADLLEGPSLREQPILILGAGGAVFLIDDRPPEVGEDDEPEPPDAPPDSPPGEEPEDAGGEPGDVLSGCSAVPARGGASGVLLALIPLLVRARRRGRDRGRAGGLR